MFEWLNSRKYSESQESTSKCDVWKNISPFETPSHDPMHSLLCPISVFPTFLPSLFQLYL